MDRLGEANMVAVGETTLHWVACGDGPPLVLLHGLSDSHRTWRRVVPQLSRIRRVLLLDLPGHGLSGRPDASYDLDWYARVVTRWADIVGLEDLDLVGHSYGGGVAQQMLLHVGRRIRKLALVSSGGLGRQVPMGLRLMSLGWLEPLAQPLMRTGTKLAMAAPMARCFDDRDRAFLIWANSAPGSGRALSRTVRGVIGIQGQTRGLVDRVHEIAELPPIELYWGTCDPVIPHHHGRRAASLLRDVRLVEFPGCGHFPHLERPVDFAAALTGFLEATGRPARVVVPPALPARPSWPARVLHWVGRLLRRAFGR